MASATVSVSTPGKVLVSGGYVVLNGGASLVLSTSSRFHSTVQACFEPYTGTSKAKTTFNIVVNSPQFAKSWTYTTGWSFDSGAVASDFYFSDTTPQPSSGNIYVESALLYCLFTAAAGVDTSKILPGHYELTIIIQADNDFYSHSKAVRKLEYLLEYASSFKVEGIKEEY
jgi:phosphomevalonate kinase